MHDPLPCHRRHPHGTHCAGQPHSTLAWGAMSLLLCAILTALPACGPAGSTEVLASGPPRPVKTLRYTENPVQYALGLPIPPNNPVVEGGTPTSFSVSPALPTGLTLDPTTGVIQGTPPEASPAAHYAVVAANEFGSATCDLTIAVAGAFVLVDDETPAIPVYYYGGVDEADAAGTLAHYLEKVSGKDDFRVTEGPETVPERGILVGRVPFAGYEFPDGLGEDSFVIRTLGDCIQITGGTSRGTHFGVSTFLERYLGCRFWALEPPDFQDWAETIPETYPLGIAPPNLNLTPAFEFRDAGSKESRNVAYAKRRMTWGYYGFSEVDYVGGPHNLHELVESDKYGSYAASHPEIYPAPEPGPAASVERVRNNIHLCYTDPGLPQALVDAISIEVMDNGGEVAGKIYWVGTGDWWGGCCQCDRCRAIYEEETWTSRTTATSIPDTPRPSYA